LLEVGALWVILIRESRKIGSTLFDGRIREIFWRPSMTVAAEASRTALEATVRSAKRLAQNEEKHIP